VALHKPPVTQLVEDADDKLFESVLHNPEHSLYQLLPDRRHDIYLLSASQTTRPHSIVVDYIVYLTNFITRQLFKYIVIVLTFYHFKLRPVSLFNKTISI